jgi:hypothetical protein
MGGSTPGTGAPGGNPGPAAQNGLVIVRYLGSQRATGGAVTSSGGYTIHTFNLADTGTNFVY